MLSFDIKASGQIQCLIRTHQISKKVKRLKVLTIVWWRVYQEEIEFPREIIIDFFDHYKIRGKVFVGVYNFSEIEDWWWYN